MADSGEEFLRARRVSGGDAKGEKRRKSGAIYGGRGLVGKLGFGRGAASRSTASRAAVREEDIGPEEGDD
jgi:hypothetical protein